MRVGIDVIGAMRFGGWLNLTLHSQGCGVGLIRIFIVNR
jgi:hypothetical protein